MRACPCRRGMNFWLKYCTPGPFQWTWAISRELTPRLTIRYRPLSSGVLENSEWPLLLAKDLADLRRLFLVPGP